MEAITHRDPKKAAKAMQAMMKIDAEQIRRAVAE